MKQQITQTKFDEFWEAYPHKVKRILCRDKYWPRVDPELHDMIIEHVKQRTMDGAQWQGEKMYIPHPSTFLNQELWTDEYAKVETIVDFKSMPNDELLAMAREQGVGTVGKTRKELIERLSA